MTLKSAVDTVLQVLFWILCVCIAALVYVIVGGVIMAYTGATMDTLNWYGFRLVAAAIFAFFVRKIWRWYGRAVDVIEYE